MNNCKISIYLVYGMSIYVLASIYYVLKTRTIGTPFNDSLTPKQVVIKNKSSNIRRNIFFQGVACAAIGLLIFRPFAQCF